MYLELIHSMAVSKKCDVLIPLRGRGWNPTKHSHTSGSGPSRLYPSETLWLCLCFALLLAYRSSPSSLIRRLAQSTLP